MAQFLVYNLGSSLIAAVWMAGLIVLLTRLLRIRSAEVKNRLLSVALLKSTLVLVGLSTAMPIPVGFWQPVQARGVPFEKLGPLFLALTGVVLVAFHYLRSRTASRMVAHAVRVGEGERAAVLTKSLVDRLNRGSMKECRCYGYRFEARIPRPVVFRSPRAAAVAVVDARPPAIVIPVPLEQSLDDEELEAVLAHELAHLAIRRPVGCCDPTSLRPLAWLNPSSWALARMFDDDEELACDEMATRVTGKPEALASAVLKSYRFERIPLLRPTVAVAGFLGKKRILSRRLSRLVYEQPRLGPPSQLRVAIAWTVVFALGFLRL